MPWFQCGLQGYNCPQTLCACNAGLAAPWMISHHFKSVSDLWQSSHKVIKKIFGVSHGNSPIYWM